MMNAAIKVGACRIGLDRPPFVIAEMSGNHNGSLKRALAIVDAAADAGAHALKIQTYTADTMTIDVREREFRIGEKKSLWYGRSLHELYHEAHTPWAWHKPIFDRCRRRGIVGFSTPFDASAVDFLEKLHVPVYKIASFENVDLPLIRRVARTGKPVIISSGLASTKELAEAVVTARKAGCRDLIVLKCTSNYPAGPESANLLTIPDIRRRFGVEAGLSDHTMGIGVSVAAVALGATVLEKHFTLRRADGGVDSAFSLEPQELRALAIETERAWKARGRVFYGPTASERPSLKYRRSLYVVRDMKKGESLTPENLRAIRPGLGLPPKFYDAALGKRVRRNVKRGTPLTKALFSA